MLLFSSCNQGSPKEKRKRVAAVPETLNRKRRNFRVEGKAPEKRHSQKMHQKTKRKFIVKNMHYTGTHTDVQTRDPNGQTARTAGNTGTSQTPSAAAMSQRCQCCGCGISPPALCLDTWSPGGGATHFLLSPCFLWTNQPLVPATRLPLHLPCLEELYPLELKLKQALSLLNCFLHGISSQQYKSN